MDIIIRSIKLDLVDSHRRKMGRRGRMTRDQSEGLGVDLGIVTVKKKIAAPTADTADGALTLAPPKKTNARKKDASVADKKLSRGTLRRLRGRQRRPNAMTVLFW